MLSVIIRDFFVSSWPEIPFQQCPPTPRPWGENIKHVFLPRWQPALCQMGDTCKPDLRSQKHFKIGSVWWDTVPWQVLLEPPGPDPFQPLSRPACLVHCEILIELLMTPRGDTTHEALPRLSQEEPFSSLLQNRRHWELTSPSGEARLVIDSRLSRAKALLW